MARRKQAPCRPLREHDCTVSLLRALVHSVPTAHGLARQPGLARPPDALMSPPGH
jgi:hypothetical protein